MKRHVILLVLVGCGIGMHSCSVVDSVRSYRKTLVFDRIDIQQELEKHFPLKKDAEVEGHTVMTFVLSNPQVSFLEKTNRIGIHLDSGCEFPKIRLKKSFPTIQLDFGGEVFFSGELDYIPKKGRFYFTNIMLHKFEMPGLTEKYEKYAREILSVVAKAYLNNVPIYSLEDRGLKE